MTSQMKKNVKDIVYAILLFIGVCVLLGCLSIFLSKIQNYLLHLGSNEEITIKNKF